jgi:hypothetical protein
MSRAARSAVAAAILLMIVGVLLPDDGERLTPTSFGTFPYGHRAVYELLRELGFPVRRSFAPPDRIAAGSAVWWIRPDGLCSREDETPLWELTGFLEQGGTALVFPPRDCSRIGSLEIPSRGGRSAAEGSEGGEAEDAQREKSEEEPEPDLLDRWREGDLGVGYVATETQRLEGGPGPGSRELDAPRLLRFSESGDFEVRARLEGEPFILEKPVGEGTLVLIADGSFLINAFLDHADNAPLVVDLASHYGVDLLDEFGHGMHRERDAISYLARSSALPVFAGLALLGLLALWRGSTLPQRCVDAGGPPAPALDRFVASLAALYARSRDQGRVAERYRELTLARLRRSFGLPAETPAEQIVERLRRDRRLSPALLRCLTEPEEPRNEAALRAQARRLDALVKEAVR